jgi:hypothetical protein
VCAAAISMCVGLIQSACAVVADNDILQSWPIFVVSEVLAYIYQIDYYNLAEVGAVRLLASVSVRP